MSYKKSNLPTKICKSCKKPFTWRKKWQKDWENVLYCSKKCSKKNRNINFLSYL
ncbi:DUF2256 domain-containing protein [Alphaproteobacteria bacterium]|nr:DUF2256 domain-containing protein [Alphaproteobacteria bacterium]